MTDQNTNAAGQQQDRTQQADRQQNRQGANPGGTDANRDNQADQQQDRNQQTDRQQNQQGGQNDRDTDRSDNRSDPTRDTSGGNASSGGAGGANANR